MTHVIHFIRENLYYTAQDGMSLMEAQIAAGILCDAPCGGVGICGKCEVLVDGQRVLACRTIVNRDMDVNTSFKDQDMQILCEGPGRKVACIPGNLPADVRHPILAAVDLGTTSIVVCLMDGLTGEVLVQQGCINPQRKYGADVVNRADYALKHDARSLSEPVRSAINELLHTLAQTCGRDATDIVRVVMVGNCGMHHLFLELPVESLVQAPYVPYIKEEVEVLAADVGISVHPSASVAWLPNIGGFVGSDTTACLLAVEFDRREKLTLLVDIGTNGEIALGTKDRFVTCSTAAGPAFEGARITCGMRGGEGAIDRVWLEDGKLAFHVIGEGEAKGICGSGLLDAVCCLLEIGQIEESGYMEEPWYFTQSVFLKGEDVRELQLAKAAIAAGIRMLCRYLDVQIEDIEELLLAGAFGNYLDPVSACAIGLLPPALQERITPVGNAAGEGAGLAVLNKEEFLRGCRIARDAEFLELAVQPEFQNLYVDELMFGEDC